MPAIKVHHTAIDDGAWDGSRNVARLRSGESAAYYARMFAWRDPGADETTKGAYKLPHHIVGANGEPGAANVRGCQSAIAVLNGAMGGADIPDGDRQAVYRHLAAHLRDADVEPAELKGLRLSNAIERRFMPQAELRAIEDEDGRTHIRGYGAVFEEWSEDLGGFREQIAPGAFTKTLQEADVRSLWNHDRNYVLGRTSSGTLSLAVDRRGLRYDVILPDAQWARDLAESIRRGDVDGSSFGFRTIKDEWRKHEDDSVARRLLEVELFDVGPVTWPAYPQTSAEARARAMEMIASEPPGGGHSDDEADPDDSARARLDVRRRELDLLEVEI